MNFSRMMLATALLFFFSACSKDRITGGGTTRTETRATPTFNAVSISGSNTVYITQGTSFKVEITGYENLLPFFESTVVNNELRLGYRNGTRVKNDNISVNITMPGEISFLNVMGSGNINVAGNFISNNIIDLMVSGSGNINFQQGSAPRATLIISGSGNINAFGLSVREGNTTVNGSGDIQTTVIEKLNANVTGSGNIYYKGSPAIVNTIIVGSGKVIRQ